MPRGIPRIASIAQLHARCTPNANGCILYPETVHRYGTIVVERFGRMTTQRAAWALTHGEIPVGFYVCHTCDTPRCCNPEHLFLGTQKDNMQDKVRKGRHVPGGRRGISKEAVMEMHQMRQDGLGVQEIADLQGLCYVAAQYILTGVRHRKEFVEFYGREPEHRTNRKTWETPPPSSITDANPAYGPAYQAQEMAAI